jgi:hypothetical protein
MRQVVCALLWAISVQIGCARANAVLPMGCTGSVFIMPGMSGEQNALVLTNGHCLDVGDYEWQGARHLRPDQFLFNYVMDKADYLISVFRSRGQGGNNYAVKRIVFGTITVTDLAIIELSVTYSDLKNSGYRIYQLAKYMPKKGMTLEFRSYNQNFDGICRVHGLVPTVVEGPYAWTNVVKMELNEKCRIYPGVSGTPGILKHTNEIYAVGNTEYTGGGRECDIMNPCERDVASGKLQPGLPTQTYAMPTAPLYDCYNTASSRFDFDMKGCSLKNAGGNH